ncbi:LysR family transcriptional regulator [Roseobacter weihaiensis]|uniref:LysR family transcriptional regulator n=1 Tax=Roseobacter weihaiensis TaxID=2763262 RepID=UPI001D0AF7F2|nr:LysR family transcriptional regulator [Roseobacter sp. H9]
MDNWDEIKTAFQVARMGTVSGAADVLGVHHATVIRHIDALEGRLGVKLFQRHARGYTATEAGRDLLRVAQATDDQFNQLAGRIKGRGNEVSGDLVVTSLIDLAPRMAPILVAFQEAYPDVVVRYLTGERLFRLEYGEAHVAIRAGTVPAQPDNVVQTFHTHRMGLYASARYIEKHGKPDGVDSFKDHRFVAHDADDSRAPFEKWLRQHAPVSTLVFRSTDTRALRAAIIAGAGIGFLPVFEAQAHPELQEVHPEQEVWSGPLWLVTHVDLHRTTKVQTFLNFLKAAAKDWDT